MSGHAIWLRLWLLCTLVTLYCSFCTSVEAESNVQNVARTIREGEKSKRILNLWDELSSGGTTREAVRYNLRKSGVFDPNSLFMIDADWLMVGQTSPDRERLCLDKLCDCQRSPVCRINFFVDVARSGEHLVWRVLNITVGVEDVNDVAPTFALPRYWIHLQENDQQAQAELPAATDPDWGSKVCRYELRDGEDSAERFTVVRKTGDRFMLAARSALNREEKETYNIVLIAIECGPPGSVTTAKNGTTDLTVVVRDVDDNAPYFEQAVYTINVSEEAAEGTQSILVLSANDVDEQPRINYTLQPDSPFVLRMEEQNEAHIDLVRPLDFEARRQYNLTVTAHSGLHSATALVVVNVLDANDNAPEIRLFDVHSRAFCNEPHVDDCVLMRENLPADTLIAKVHVSDGDASRDFGYVQCAVQSDGDGDGPLVKLLPTSYPTEKDARFSLLTARPFDREQETKVRATIDCYNQNKDEMHAATRTLMIFIGDVNDNAPAWADQRMHLRVSENNPIGTLIGVVKAFDPDLNENGSVTYRLLPSADAHLVSIVSNASTGYIKALATFDRERRHNVTVQVVAYDSGSPPLNSSTMELVFEIEDMNDNVPLFENRTYLFSIPESNQLAHESGLPCRTIGKVIATDADVTDRGRLDYSVLSVMGDERVRIDPSEFRMDLDGMLSVCTPLDRETHEQMTIVLQARDSAQHVATATVYLQINDVNDCLPTLRGTTDFEIGDEAHAGAVIAQLSAEDRDANQNDRVEFRLVDNPEGLFRLEPNGLLKLARALTEKDATRSLFRPTIELHSSAQETSTAPKYTLTVRVKERVLNSDPVYSDSMASTNADKAANANGSTGGGSHFLLIVFLVTLAGTLCIVVLLVFVFLKRDALFKPNFAAPKSDEEGTPDSDVPDDLSGSGASMDEAETDSLGELKRRHQDTQLRATCPSRCSSDRLKSPTYAGYEPVLGLPNINATSRRSEQVFRKTKTPSQPADQISLSLQRSRSFTQRLAQRGGTLLNSATFGSPSNDSGARKQRQPAVVPDTNVELASVHGNVTANANATMNRAFLKSPFVTTLDGQSRVLVSEKCDCPDCAVPLPIGFTDASATYGMDALHDSPQITIMPGITQLGPPCFPFGATDVPQYCEYSSEQSTCGDRMARNGSKDDLRRNDPNGNALEYRAGDGNTKRPMVVVNCDTNAPQAKIAPNSQTCSTNVHSVVTMLPGTPKASAKSLRSIYNEASNV